MLKLVKCFYNIAKHREINIFSAIVPIYRKSTVIPPFPTDRYFLLSLEGIDKMVSMGRIGVFYPEFVHTQCKFSWENFVAPNARVGTQWIIATKF